MYNTVSLSFKKTDLRQYLDNPVVPPGEQSGAQKEKKSKKNLENPGNEKTNMRTWRCDDIKIEMDELENSVNVDPINVKMKLEDCKMELIGEYIYLFIGISTVENNIGASISLFGFMGVRTNYRSNKFLFWKK